MTKKTKKPKVKVFKDEKGRYVLKGKKKVYIRSKLSTKVVEKLLAKTMKKPKRRQRKAKIVKPPLRPESEIYQAKSWNPEDQKKKEIKDALAIVPYEKPDVIRYQMYRDLAEKAKREEQAAEQRRQDAEQRRRDAEDADRRFRDNLQAMILYANGGIPPAPPIVPVPPMPQAVVPVPAPAPGAGPGAGPGLRRPLRTPPPPASSPAGSAPRSRADSVASDGDPNDPSFYINRLTRKAKNAAKDRDAAIKAKTAAQDITDYLSLGGLSQDDISHDPMLNDIQHGRRLIVSAISGMSPKEQDKLANRIYSKLGSEYPGLPKNDLLQMMIILDRDHNFIKIDDFQALDGTGDVTDMIEHLIDPSSPPEAEPSAAQAPSPILAIPAVRQSRVTSNMAEFQQAQARRKQVMQNLEGLLQKQHSLSAQLIGLAQKPEGEALKKGFMDILARQQQLEIQRQRLDAKKAQEEAHAQQQQAEQAKQAQLQADIQQRDALVQQIQDTTDPDAALTARMSLLSLDKTLPADQQLLPEENDEEYDEENDEENDVSKDIADLYEQDNDVSKDIAELQQGKGSSKNDGLYDDEINSMMKPYARKGYKGVYSIDEINKIPVSKDNFGAVLNLDPSYKAGSHWVALFYNKKDNSLDWYDSFGEEPPQRAMKDLKRLVDKINPKTLTTFKVNRIIQQSASSSNCGWFAMRFLTDRFNGIKFKDATGYSEARKGEKDIKAFKKRFPKFGVFKR